jgi:hypothetical protein
MYSFGDASMKMVDKERTCLLQLDLVTWHTQKIVDCTKVAKTNQGLVFLIQKCNIFGRNKCQYAAIQCWWYSSRVVPKNAIHEHYNWLGFWHFHVRQWEGFMLHVRHLFFRLIIIIIIIDANYQLVFLWKCL